MEFKDKIMLHGYRKVKCQSETVSREGEYGLALKFRYCEPSIKKMWGETESLMLLFWSTLFVGGRDVRWKRWGIVRWRGGKGEKVVRWKGGEGEGE